MKTYLVPAIHKRITSFFSILHLFWLQTKRVFFPRSLRLGQHVLVNMPEAETLRNVWKDIFTSTLKPIITICNNNSWLDVAHSELERLEGPKVIFCRLSRQEAKGSRE